jgi:predicted small integral membrane protein
MSPGQGDGDGVLSRTKSPGLAVGLAAYFVSLGLTLALVRSGAVGTTGVWERAQSDLPRQLLAHQAAHAPAWNASLHPEMLPVTAVLVVVVGVAGVVLGRATVEIDERAEAFQASSRLFVGYLPGTFVASAYIGFAGPSIEWVTLVAPTLLAGVVFPALVGGAGGVVAVGLEQRESGPNPDE